MKYTLQTCAITEVGGEVDISDGSVGVVVDAKTFGYYEVRWLAPVLVNPGSPSPRKKY